MLTDDTLPQPFRFLNEIVHQVIEDAIEIAVQREASLTQVKRLRIPKDIVQLPLMTGIPAVNGVYSGGGGGGSNNNNTNNADGTATSVSGSEEGSGGQQEATRGIDRMTNATAKTAQSRDAAAAAASSSSSSSAGPAFITAVGDAGALLVLARNGTFTARDQSLPDDVENDNADYDEAMTAPIPGTVGEVSVVPIATDAAPPAGENPSQHVVGCLPFAPGEEVAAACISSATGAVAVATAFGSSASLSGTGSPVPPATPGQQQQQDSALLGPSASKSEVTASGCGGRLLLYSSVSPASAQQQQQQHGVVPVRRSGMAKLTGQQQPDFAVLLPQGCTATRVEISADEQYVAVVVSYNGSSSGSNSSPFGSPTGSPAGGGGGGDKQGRDSSSAAAAPSSPLGGNNGSPTAPQSPEVLLYRKIQPQDCFFGAPGVGGTSYGIAGGSGETTTTTVSGLSPHQQQQHTKIQLPPQCDTTLVLLGSLCPPSYAAASSSVPASAIAPYPFFLFRPVECREPTAFPVVCHTLLIAWGGFNVFSTVPLASQSLELGAPEIMRGSAVDFVAVANAAVAGAVAAVTPPPVQTLTTSMSFRRAPAAEQKEQQAAGAGAAAAAAGAPPSITVTAGTGGTAAASSSSQQQQQPPHVVPPLPPLVPLCTGVDSSRHLTHRPLPQVITTAALCRQSSRVALGLAEGVVGVWTQEPPCFSTVTAAAPHRSDSLRPARRPMVVSSVSFYRDTHLVAGLCVPVQIKSLDDIPSVHYSRVVVVELASGSIVASVPHVPGLSVAVALAELPIVLLFGNRCFWAASIYSGELLAEIPCGVSGVANALSPPQTTAGKPLMSFCNSLQLSMRTCPFTGSFYGAMCGSSSSSSNNNSSTSSSSGLPYFFRVDGVSLAAGLRPLQNRRDDIMRSCRSISQVAGIVTQALIARAGSKEAQAAAMSVSQQQQLQASKSAAAVGGGGNTAAAGGGAGNALATPAGATAAAANAALLSGFSEAAAVLAAATGGAGAAGRGKRGIKGARRKTATTFSSGEESGGGYSSGEEQQQQQQQLLKTSSSMVPQPPTAQHLVSLGGRSAVGGSTHYATSTAMDGASTRGGATTLAGGTTAALNNPLMTPGAVSGAVNEQMQLPIAEIGKKLSAGKADRAKKVNKLLDDLLGLSQVGVTVIGK